MKLDGTLDFDSEVNGNKGTKPTLIFNVAVLCSHLDNKDHQGKL